MPHTPDPRPRREFPREGFTLYLDADGLELRVDDYHPQPLKLSWKLLEQLRRDGLRSRAAGKDGAR
jgi:hypothetical protein